MGAEKFKWKRVYHTVVFIEVHYCEIVLHISVFIEKYIIAKNAWKEKTLVRELVKQLSNNCELVTLLLEWLKLTEKG